MVTIKQIAEKAGVSIGTVDRVLHNRGYVSQQAEQKIRQAIAELDYKPNIFARHLKLSRPFKFGVLMPEFKQDCGYWEMPGDGIRKAQSELKTHRIEIEFFHYERYSEKSFLNVCQKALHASLNGLLVAPLCAPCASEMIQKIPSNLPYVFFDSTLPNAHCLSSIVQDSFMSGQLAGHLMSLLINDPGIAATIRILPEDFHIDERIRGFEAFLKDHPYLKVVSYEATLGDRTDKISSIIDNILKSYDQIRGLFIPNALTFQFVQALQNKHCDRKIHVIGYDLLKENIDYLKKGQIDFLISQQSRQQGYHGIYTLFRHVVLNEVVPPKMMMAIDIIAKENVDYYQMK